MQFNCMQDQILDDGFSPMMFLSVPGVVVRDGKRLATTCQLLSSFLLLHDSLIANVKY